MFDMFADRGSPRVDHPLDAVILKLRPCKSCREAVRMLRQVREEMRNK
jgi:hypothetical protein